MKDLLSSSPSMNRGQDTMGQCYTLPIHVSLAETRDLSKLVRSGIPLSLLAALPRLLDHSTFSKSKNLWTCCKIRGGFSKTSVAIIVVGGLARCSYTPEDSQYARPSFALRARQ